jgi:hypothetical protein
MSEYDFHFFDKESRAITQEAWAKLNMEKVFYKDQYVGGLRVLTKWTGVDQPEYKWLCDHSFIVNKWTPQNKPMIFVSYVWNEDQEIIRSKRYNRLQTAYVGHMEMLDWAKKEIGIELPQKEGALI